jgi:hypothetical protein
MCAANGELENGDPESPVDFLCHVAHLRAYALGFDVPEHGDCAYCNGGKSQEELMKSAARIRNQSGDGSAWVESNATAPFQILQSGDSCGSGGCGSCGMHHG